MAVVFGVYERLCFVGQFFTGGLVLAAIGTEVCVADGIIDTKTILREQKV